MSVHKLAIIPAVEQRLTYANAGNDIELSDKDLDHLAAVCVARSACNAADICGSDRDRGTWLGSKKSFSSRILRVLEYAKLQRKVLGLMLG